MPDIINQLIETMSTTNNLLTAQLSEANAKLAAADSRYEELSVKLAAADSRYEELSAKLDEAHVANEKLLNANLKSAEKIAELLEKITELTEQIKKLQEKQSLDSRNSSIPPSSDGLKKKPVNKNRSLRTSSGKNPGGQEGHKGATYSVIDKPDKVVKHMPALCVGCPHREECLANAKVVETRTVVDVKTVTEITAHELVTIKKCKEKHIRLTGEFPEEIRANMQFGTNLQALVVSFNTLGAVSISRIHEILGNVFGIPLSTGTISSMLTKASDKVKPALEQIKQRILLQEMTHSDESGFRVEGKTRWAHVMCTDALTYLGLSDFRGQKGMNEIGLLSQYKGINIHDCWSSYWQYPDIVHAICNAHILRELNFVTDNYPEQTWNDKFRNLLLEMKSVKERILSEGGAELTKEDEIKFLTWYDEIIKLAYQENPQPKEENGKTKKRGRKKKGKVLSLIERLDTNKAAVCRFIMDFRVDFDNNQAERDIRCIKIKNKVSGCFRTIAGAREYLDIMSYISTARKLGFNGFEAISKALNNDACYIFA